MKPIIKWPGGKSREIDQIIHLIPEFDRYVEPFFGGGALYFHLAPKAAAINDISVDLMQYYRLIQEQDPELEALLLCYSRSFRRLIELCGQEAATLVCLFFRLKENALSREDLRAALTPLVSGITDQLGQDFSRRLLLDRQVFENHLLQMAEDKFLRTVTNDRKKPFSPADLRDNLITGFTGGYYMYFRGIFNDIGLGRLTDVSVQYRIANFYFIREYCYGSMFRYNTKGEFNIPYGGMSYNRKDMETKVRNMFCGEAAALFSGTEIHCRDFEEFLDSLRLTDRDFLFLDPPYDTDFSDYEGKDFTKRDQERLADVLKRTPAKFILVIKNTEFIYNLYAEHFNILSFDKEYTYNVRSRNDRGAEHLIITNLPV